ncbi:uncharacterized protein LOC131659623 [Vicia villosa]|uniref:uncharacterized protein LOC131659623 n=1 Tax=Vicia villosa TaxID=3911 RepID=UPI00273C76F0|nr:uncharacterized protein LOC131659623 [Vicia villosa]
MECFHWMKKKTKGKRGVMALKLDMSKAYDRIEWPFVVGVLSSMGFPASMVNLIQRCISIVSYKVLVNGQPSRSFVPERGLRQGDPLSPYLFILCADVFSGLLKQDAARKNIHGIEISRQAPMISHLLFADDSLLFARANETEADCILDTMRKFLRSSGQIVNLDNSEVSFSRNVRDDAKIMICTRMGVKTILSHSKYLGLPVVFGRSKREVFNLVIERVWKKIKGWKERFLSTAGKEVLIKAVVQAIPSYIMSCYKLPETVCHEIEAMIAKFWWGSREGEKKVHWMNWEKMARAKEAGGMGFRGISAFNTSLLGKQYWRILTNGDSLLGRIFKSRYFPRGTLENCTGGSAISYAWRSVMSARSVIQKGTRWRIGTGEKVSVARGRWIPGNTGFKICGPVRASDDNLMVSDLVDSDLGSWQKEKIFALFNEEDAKQIISIPLSTSGLEDKIIWHFEKDGEYSVRSAYHLCMQEKADKLPGPSSPPDTNLWKAIWKAPVAPRIRNFIWRAAKNILPSKDNLLKKGIQMDGYCSFCHSQIESVQHLLLQCVFSVQCYFASILSCRVPNNTHFLDWLESTLSCGDDFSVQLLCTLMHKIWRARNCLLYQNKASDPIKVAAEALDSVLEFNKWNPVLSAKRKLTSQEEHMPQDVHVLQVDAGSFPTGFVAFGCVIKDPNGTGILAACKKDMLSIDPLVAEILGIRWSLQLAKSLNLERILVQSDCLNAVDCINSVVHFAVLEPIAIDCRSLLGSFAVASVMFIKRSCNVEAHSLVGIGNSLGSRTWLGGVPSLDCIASRPLAFSF